MGSLRDDVIAAVLAELDDYIDPPMATGLTIPQSDRLWIARRAAQRVLKQARLEPMVIYEITRRDLGVVISAHYLVDEEGRRVAIS